jgi:glutathione S-transferase
VGTAQLVQRAEGDVEEQRDWSAIGAALARCERHFAMLERVVEKRPFLLGDTLSLADIAAGTGVLQPRHDLFRRPARSARPTS